MISKRQSSISDENSVSKLGCAVSANYIWGFKEPGMKASKQNTSLIIYKILITC